MSQDTTIQPIEEEVQPKSFMQSVGYAGGTFAGIGIIDAAAHLGPTGLVFAAIGSVLAYKHGADIREGVAYRYARLDPKSKAAIRFVAARFGHDVQVEEIEEKPAQPKDDARRVVDESEEEYLAPLPTPQLKQAKQQEEYDWYSDDEDDTALPMMSGLFTFSDVLAKGFIPTLKNIYIGSYPDGTPIYVEAKDLCHVALAGNTGGGKSSLMRMLMAQLCYAGATVLLLNPHYTPYDREHDEDWTPFTPFLKEDPLLCSEYKNIEYYIKALVEVVLPKRQARVRAGELPGKPYFVVIDELPAIAKKCKDVPGAMEELLREGRKYGIFLIVASQDFLVKTIGTDGGAVRQCFRTAFYVGGDTTTARNLLEKELVIPETSLGKGTVMLRCAATKQTVIAKVPYVDNAVLYRLLGPSTFVPAPSNMGDALPSLSAPAPQASAYPVSNAPITRQGGLETPRQAPQCTPTDASVTRQYEPVNAPTEHAHTASDARQPRYKMMSDIQAAQFVAAYRIRSNMDYCLKSAGCSSLYREHARQLISENGLSR